MIRLAGKINELWLGRYSTFQHPVFGRVCNQNDLHDAYGRPINSICKAAAQTHRIVCNRGQTDLFLHLMSRLTND